MVNKVILIGNVGADPIVRYLDGGVAVTTLSLVTTETFIRNGEKVEQTEWHDVVLWRSLAEIAEKYVRKGSRLYIEGRLRSRTWEDKEHVKRRVTEVFADNMVMLGGGASGNASGSGKTAAAGNAAAKGKAPAATPKTDKPEPGKEENAPF